MKRNILTGLIFISIISCSPEPTETSLLEKNDSSLNFTVEEHCAPPTEYDFDEAGVLKVSNSATTLYIEILPTNGYSLNKTRLHIAPSQESFPTVGQGNLPPGQMEYQIDNPSSSGHRFQFELNGLPECFFIASHSIFNKDKIVVETWAGKENFEKWSSFKFCEVSCEVTCEGRAGTDIIDNNLSLEDLKNGPAIDAYWSVLEMRAYAISLLPLEVQELSTDGTFNPTLQKIRDDMWDHIVRNGLTEPYIIETIYTAEFDGCQDEVKLKIYINPN